MKPLIEREHLLFLATCSECKRTFSGEDSKVEAQQHAILFNHHVKGEERHLLVFNPLGEFKP